MRLEIFGVEGIGEVVAGDDLAELIVRNAPTLADGDVLVVSSKIVSKAEGQLRTIDREAAIDAETVRVVARRGDTRIVTTKHGFVMAAAGVDASNVPKGSVVLLPVDSDASARRIRDGVRERLGVNVGVVVTDTFGRPWRNGVTDAAVGVAGVAALDDLRGSVDSYGNELQVTITCTVDEIAAAADLVKGKLDGVPVAIIRGLEAVLPADHATTPSIAQLVRPADEDMFPFGSRDVIAAITDHTQFSGEPVDPAQVARALRTAAAGADLNGEQTVRFDLIAVDKGLVDDVPVGCIAVVVPTLTSANVTPADFARAGAVIEKVLLALAIEQLGVRWVWPTHYPLGAIAVGVPAKS